MAEVMARGDRQEEVALAGLEMLVSKWLVSAEKQMSISTSDWTNL